MIPQKTEARLGEWDERRVVDNMLGHVSTGVLLEELAMRGERIMDAEGRSLQDYSRQMRCTLRLEIINGLRPEDPARGFIAPEQEGA